MKIPKIWSSPPGSDPVQKKNYLNSQVDAIGVAFGNAATPFLPVFLTRLGASAFEVSLLTSMPAMAGLLLTVPLGQFLQNQKNVAPWYTSTRTISLLFYGLTGALAIFLHGNALIIGILAIWALATVPQAVVNITFSVVMNAVAGPHLRLDLLMRRWSILGVTTAVMFLVTGQILERIRFPLNYEIAFLILGLGGFISYYFSSKIHLGDIQSHRQATRLKMREQLKEYMRLVSREKPFQTFVLRRFVVLSGSSLILPIFPLYLVKVVHASDAWIAIINTVQTAIVILGYFFWTNQSRHRGTRPVLLWTTFGTAFYPILVAFTQSAAVITVIGGLYGIFLAGLNLVFFDELMKTVPTEYSSTFVALAQGIQYFSSILAPILGTIIADQVSLSAALITGGTLQLIGFAMFFFGKPAASMVPAKNLIEG